MSVAAVGFCQDGDKYQAKKAWATRYKLWHLIWIRDDWVWLLLDNKQDSHLIRLRIVIKSFKDYTPDMTWWRWPQHDPQIKVNTIRTPVVWDSERQNQFMFLSRRLPGTTFCRPCNLREKCPSIKLLFALSCKLQPESGWKWWAPGPSS